MKIYRSTYFWKNKQWNSDFKVKNDCDNTVDNRIKYDIKRFMAHTGLVKEVVEKMIDVACKSNIPKEKWLEEFGWTMIDCGEIKNDS